MTAAIAGGAIATELADASVHRTPRFIAGSWTGRRPMNVYISGDRGNIITHIHWRAWKRWPFWPLGAG